MSEWWGPETLLGKLWTIVAAVALSIVAPVSAEEDFNAVRGFLDTTSPIEAKSDRADQPANPGARSKPARSPVFVQPETGQRLALDLLGKAVIDPHGEVLGEVDDLLLNPNGRIVGVVVSHGGILGFGEHIVGVNWSHISRIGRAVELKAMPSALADAPPFVPPSQTSPRE